MRKNYIIVRKLFTAAFIVQTLNMVTGQVGALVDAMVIGKCLGINAMTAYGLVAPLTIVFTAIAGALGNGICTHCSGILGLGEVDEANRSLSSSLVYSVITGAVLGVLVAVLARPIVMILGGSGVSSEVAQMAVDYVLIFAFSLPGMVICTALIPLFQVDGDKNRPNAAIVIMVAFNIVGDLVNGLFLKLGMGGMAFVTSITYYFAMIPLLFHFFDKKCLLKFSLKRLSAKYMKDIVSIGLPFGMHMMFRFLGVYIINIILLRVGGENPVAAFAAINSIGNLLRCVGEGIGSGMMMLSNMMDTEKDITSLKKLFVVGIVFSIVLNVVVIPYLLLLSEGSMLLFFNRTDDLFGMAVEGMKIFSLCMIPFCINSAFRGFYHGMHNLVPTYIISFFDDCGGQIAMVGLFAVLLGMSGAWWGFIAGEFVATIVMLIFILIRSRKIKDINTYMLLPKTYEKYENWVSFEADAWNMDEVIKASESIRQFCIENGAEGSTAYTISLAIEELGGNTILYAFNKEYKYSIQLRVTRSDTGWILRMRDNCMAFDPKKNVSLYENEEDPTAHVGIKLIMGLVKNIKYVNTLSMNNVIIEI